MFKLAAAIRNHFVVVPYFEAKALCSISPRRILAPTMQGAGIPRRFPSIVVPKLLAAVRTPLHPAEIEKMNASVRGPHRPASTPPLFPDPAWASLACKAPAVCSQLQRMGR
jgi:hypothetical protein